MSSEQSRKAMDATRVDVKLFVEGNAQIEAPDLIAVFHAFIQRGAIENELLIDVTDYTHVSDGPGVLLIAHEGLYAFDNNKGRHGLLYSQRRARIDGGFRAALSYGIRQALRICALLEREESLRG